jgi:hypothetical protein
MKRYRGSGGTAPLILSPHTKVEIYPRAKTVECGVVGPTVGLEKWELKKITYLYVNRTTIIFCLK